MFALECQEATKVLRYAIKSFTILRKYNNNFADELSDLTGSGSEDTFDDLERGMENLEC